MCEFEHALSEWITVQHEVHGGETQILAKSLPKFEERGWHHVHEDGPASTALVSFKDSDEESFSEPEFDSAEYEGE